MPDPADAAGGACSAGVVTLDLTQSASKEIRAKPPKLWPTAGWQPERARV